MLIVRREGEGDPGLRVTTYTLPGEMDERQKHYEKQTFVQMALSLLLTDLCLALALFAHDLFCALVGLIAGVRAISAIRRYGDIVLGDGLRADWFFFSECIRIYECGSMADIGYDRVTSAVRIEIGLVLRFADGSGRVLPALALSEADNEDELCSLLRQKLGGRFTNKLLESDYQLRIAEEHAFEKNRREETLGRQLAAIIYEVDHIDRRDYCRLLMKTGKTGVFLRVMTSVLGGLLTGGVIFAMITENPVLTVLCYLLGAFLLLLQLPRFIGLGGPARGRFFSEADGREVGVYLHENGVWVEGDRGTLAKKWDELDGFSYDEAIGIAFDMGKYGVAFVPADMTQPEMLSLARDKAAQGRKQGREG